MTRTDIFLLALAFGFNTALVGRISYWVGYHKGWIHCSLYIAQQMEAQVERTETEEPDVRLGNGEDKLH